MHKNFAIEIKDLVKTYKGKKSPTLNGLTLNIPYGSLFGLLAPNGAGKTTTLGAICGLRQFESGSIYVDGLSVKKNMNQIKSIIGFVPQDIALFPTLSALENLKIIGGIYGLPKKQLNSKIEELLNLFDLSDSKNIIISHYSGGMKRRINLIAGMLHDPKILILDEPTAALEEAQVASLFKLMRELAATGVAIIFTSHRLWEVVEICDDLTIFRNGENVAEMDFSKDEKDLQKIIFYITGSKEEAGIAKTCAETCGDVRLSIRNLNLGATLRDISFDLKKGEILGIGGLAGQGQQELMLALAGNFRKVACEAKIDGQPIRLTKPSNAIKHGIMLVPGDRQLEGLFSTHSVFSNLIFPKIGLDKNFVIPHGKLRKECEQIVGILALKTAGLDVPVSTLSGGNQQKVVIGKWLGLETNVLLLSDPAKGIDIGAKNDLYSYIIGEARSKGMSVILYASDSKELIEYCDRLLIMYEGTIVSTLGTEEITEENIIRASMCIEDK